MARDGAAELSAKQAKFAAALVRGATIRQAGAEAGVSERTGYTWAALPAVQEELRMAARSSLQVALRQLQQATPSAVETLQAQLTDAEPSAVRVSAAKTIIEFAIQLARMDQLAARLEELEQRVGQMDAAQQSQPRQLVGSPTTRYPWQRKP